MIFINVVLVLWHIITFKNHIVSPYGMRYAFFDIDGTLVGVGSTSVLFKYLVKKRFISFNFYFRMLPWMLSYLVGKSDYESSFRKSAKFLKDKKVSEIKKITKDCFNKKIKKHIFKEGIKKIKEHKKKGYKIVLVTLQYRELADLFKKYFKADYLISTELELKNGLITGSVKGKLCYGPEKKKKIEKFLKGKKANNCYAYGDSYVDRFMLSFVGNPFAVNPDDKLKKLAKNKGWKILRFKE